jgi:Icc-related predicted phosphoesterase
MAMRKSKHSKSNPAPYLTIVCISDTHQLHREIDVPPGDLLIHSGDFTIFSKSAASILDFNEWLGELPHRAKLVVPGNHEFFLESDLSRRKLISNATVLINEGIEIMGLKIWGSPTTTLYGGAFGMSSPADRTKLYAKIPQDTDILVTHGPPHGILDQAPGTEYYAGCLQLLAAVLRVRPRLHVFGHIHGAHGLTSNEDTVFVNAAMLGLDGDLSWPATVLRISRL